MPGWACLDYNASAAGINTVNLDFSAVTDPDFSQRNGHYIFTEDYGLFAASMVGASVIRGRFQVPHWNAYCEAAIFNANRALTPPTSAQWDLYAAMPLPVPHDEEFQVQVSNNLGAATEQENVVLALTTSDWNRNLPRGYGPFVVRTSFTVTPTINVWSGPQALTFSQSLRSGTYAVVGAVCQGANAVAFRLIFPKYKLYNGRKLRPGWICQTAIGDFVQAQIQPWVLGMGEWGRFFSFEPVQAEVLGATAAGTTYQLFLWLVQVSDDRSGMNQGLGGGL